MTGQYLKEINIAIIYISRSCYIYFFSKESCNTCHDLTVALDGCFSQIRVFATFSEGLKDRVLVCFVPYVLFYVEGQGPCWVWRRTWTEHGPKA